MIKRLRRWYDGQNLQNRLFFSYLFLFLAQLFLFGGIYYRIASDSILDLAGKNVLDITVKNTQLADEKLSEIEERARLFREEQEVKESLEKIEGAKGSEVFVLDSGIGRVVNKYFYEENVVSAYLITPNYILGNNAQIRVPVSQFYQSEIYNKISQQEERGLWIPTYYAQEEYQLGWRVEQSSVFTYIYRLDNDGKAPKEKEQELQPVLLVNLKTDLFRDIFDEKDGRGDFVYCISDREGNIIVHTDTEKEGTAEDLPWLSEFSGDGVAENDHPERPDGNGIMAVDYQGQKSVICYAASERKGWIAASIYPVSGLLKNVKKMQYFTYGLAGSLFAPVLLLAMFWSRRITRPIESLTAAMKKAEEGDFSSRIPVKGNDEMQYLVSRYNEMGMRIEKLIEENYKSEIRNKESEIMALNLQMKPHFLYNTLNIINLMALEEGEMEISRMIISVSDMLQYTFRNQQEMVRLADELEWLKNYTYIMEHRFEGKFQVVYQIEEDILEYVVPKLLLEPLVENAIIHGFRKIDSGGILNISCRLDKGTVCISIADNGQGISRERMQAVLDGSAERTGIMNVKKRLTLIYGEDADFTIESEAGKGCIILITLPCRL